MNDGIDTNMILVIALMLVVGLALGFYLGQSSNLTELSDLKEQNLKQLNELVSLTKEKAALKTQCDIDLMKANEETQKWIEFCAGHSLDYYIDGLNDMEAFYLCWMQTEEGEEQPCYDSLYEKQTAKGLEMD